MPAGTTTGPNVRARHGKSPHEILGRVGSSSTTLTWWEPPVPLVSPGQGTRLGDRPITTRSRTRSSRSIRRPILAAIAALLVAISWVPVAAPTPVDAADPPTPRFLSEETTDPGKGPGVGITAVGTPKPGFTDTIVISGLASPTAVRFSPDGRVFVAEKSGRIRVYPSLTSTTPTIFVDLRTQGPQLLGSGAARAGARSRTSRRSLTSTPSTPTTRRSAGPLPRWGRCVPVAARPHDRRLRHQRPAVALHRCRQCRHRAASRSSSRRWCQQYPSHRSATSGSGRTAPSTSAPATAQASPSRTMASGSASGGITPRNPCGDPPGGVGGAMTAPTARGGAAPEPEPSPAGGRAGRPERHDPARRSRDRRGPAGQSAVRQRRCERPADRRLRHAQPIPLHVPARERTRSGSATSATSTGRRSTGSSNPLAPTVANLGWPCYEGAGQHACVSGLEPRDVHVPLRAPTGLLAPYYAYRHRQQHRRRRDVPDGQLGHRRDHVL